MEKCLTTLIDCQLVSTASIRCDIYMVNAINELANMLAHCGTLRLFHTGECGSAGASVHPGDFTCEETHVPIPNTPVKLSRPMIVHTSAKVGYCREHFIKAGP